MDSARSLARGGASALATAAILLFGGCREPEAVVLPPPPVDVAPVLVADVPLFAEYVGQTGGTANVEVKARVEGLIESIHFREGTFVEKDQLLFEIEREPSVQKLERARATLADAQAKLDKARTDIARYTPLVEARAIPRQDLEDAQAAERAAVAGLAAGRADVRTAELDLDYTSVRAPVSGLIGSRSGDVGSLVGGMTSPALATISPLDPIWFNANLSEVDYLEATRRMEMEEANERPLTMLLPDGTEHTETGKFVFIDRAIDPTTGTLRVRAEFPNPGKRLRPGMFGRLRILLGEEKGAVLVPQRAVQEVQGTYSVFTVGDDGTAKFTRIEPTERIGSLWLVESGLEAGDVIIVEGLLKARDGAPVAPNSTTIDPAPLEGLRALIPQRN